MQISNNPVFYPVSTTDNRQSRLPVVIDAESYYPAQQGSSRPEQSRVIHAPVQTAVTDYQQAQFVHASASLASADNGQHLNALPKSVQHYLQIASISESQTHNHSGQIDEKV